MTKFVCFGEIMLRLASPAGSRLQIGKALETNLAGAEANVAVLLARLGNQAEMLSVLPDNPLARDALSELQRHGVGTQTIAFAEGRLGLYFIEQGAMMRPSQIVYDRAQSAFASFDYTSIDWAAILDGADWLHVSGITLALGDAPADAALAAAREAHRLGAKVSLDCNYRAHIWARQEQAMAERMREMVSLAHCLFAGRRDARYLLDGDFTQSDARDGFEKVCAAYRSKWPTLEVIASTNRTVIDSRHHQLLGRVCVGDGVAYSRQHDLVGIVDRVGAGDAFAGAVLDQVARRISAQQAVDFATASAAIKHSIPGDFNLTQRREIEDAIMAGNGDVQR